MDPLQSADIALEAARSWDAKGDLNWSYRNYASALLAYLAAALHQTAEWEAGRRFLREHGVNDQLAVYLERRRALIAEVESGRWPPSVLGGCYEPLVFSHMASLLDMHGAAADLATGAIAGEEPSDDLWSEYARAMRQLHERRPYEPRIPAKLKGLEVYWALYLELVADLTHGRDPAATLERVRQGFEQRNADRRLRQDHHRIEGTGDDPVRWDFRGEAILRAAEA